MKKNRLDIPNPKFYFIRDAPTVSDEEVQKLEIWKNHNWIVLLEEKEAKRENDKISFSLNYLITSIKNQRFDEMAKKAIVALVKLKDSVVVFPENHLGLLR